MNQDDLEKLGQMFTDLVDGVVKNITKIIENSNIDEQLADKVQWKGDDANNVVKQFNNLVSEVASYADSDKGADLLNNLLGALGSASVPAALQYRYVEPFIKGDDKKTPQVDLQKGVDSKNLETLKDIVNNAVSDDNIGDDEVSGFYVIHTPAGDTSGTIDGSSYETVDDFVAAIDDIINALDS